MYIYIYTLNPGIMYIQKNAQTLEVYNWMSLENVSACLTTTPVKLRNVYCSSGGSLPSFLEAVASTEAINGCFQLLSLYISFTFELHINGIIQRVLFCI